MDDPESSAASEQPINPNLGDDLPPGDHPCEVAARNGFGPLSPKAREVWHGDAQPCVSCGQLVRREETQCEHCGQNLSPDMLEKMRANAGPWFVFEHVRPFPGVSLDLIVRQIRRGVLTEASIVRGPATQYQWRFAVETPGLCRYFGWCWRCHGEVSPSDSQCPKCHAFLGFEPPRPKSETVKQSSELRELSAAVDLAEAPAHEAIWDEPPRLGRISVTWIALALIIIVILVLMWITQMRDGDNAATASTILAMLPRVSPK